MKVNQWGLFLFNMLERSAELLSRYSNLSFLQKEGKDVGDLRVQTEVDLWEEIDNAISEEQDQHTIYRNAKMGIVPIIQSFS